MPEIPFLFLSITIYHLFSVFPLSFLSFFHFSFSAVVSKWTYHCFENRSSRNCLNLELLNTVPGSVRIRFGIPCAAMYSNKKLITFSAVGFGKNSASGHRELLATETSKYHFLFIRILKRSSKIDVPVVDCPQDVLSHVLWDH